MYVEGGKKRVKGTGFSAGAIGGCAEFGGDMDMDQLDDDIP